MARSPFAATDGPNDFHWHGEQIQPGLADYSPTLTRPSAQTATEAVQIREQAQAVTLAQREVEAARAQLAAEVAAFEEAKAEKAEKAGKGKKGKKGADDE